MGFTYKIDADAGIIFFFGEGKIGAAEIEDIRKRYTVDPLYNPNFSHLIDARSAIYSFSGDEARSMADWAKANIPIAKTACVINHENQGFLRMYTAWGGENQRLFQDMASAREWLGLPPE